MMTTIDLIHALPLSERRGMNRSEAASYVSVSEGHFDKLVRNGLLPPPLSFPGVRRWDKAAIDRTLDAMSDLPQKTESPYETWKRSLGEG